MEPKLRTEDELTKLKDKELLGLVERGSLSNVFSREFESHSNNANSGVVLFGGERRQLISWILIQQQK